jgi:tetratricopeptide (TPR) repeat protein
MIDLAIELHARGRYADAEPLLQSAIDHSERCFGSSHPAVSGALNNLAVLYKYTAKFDEAGQLCRRVLAILEQEFGVDSLETATIHHNLGELEHARGRYGHGEPHARRAYEIRRRFLGDDHPQAAADAAAWAGVLDGLSRFDESEPLYRHALGVFERVYDPGTTRSRSILNNLAFVEQAKGNTRAAELLFRRALALKEDLLGAAHPDVAVTRENPEGVFIPLVSLRLFQRRAKASTWYGRTRRTESASSRSILSGLTGSTPKPASGICTSMKRS